MISVICSIEKLFCPKTLIFLASFYCHTDYCACLSPSKYLLLNSIKALKFSRLLFKLYTIIFAHVNCCFSPIPNLYCICLFFFWNNVFKARLQKTESLYGFAHAYRCVCIKKSSCLDVRWIKNIPLKLHPVFIQAGSHLAGMNFFGVNQTWKFHRNDHYNGILLK